MKRLALLAAALLGGFAIFRSRRAPAVQPLPASVVEHVTPSTTTLRDAQITVQQGQTLSSIARALYRDALLWPAIFDASRAALSDPDKLVAGLSLTVPNLGRLSTAYKEEARSRARRHQQLWTEHAKTRRPGSPVLTSFVLFPNVSPT